MLTEGTLRRYIDELAVTGLTSNPTILGDAMATSTDYDDSLRRHLTSGVRDPQELMNPDYAAAARSRRSQRQNGWHLPARARRLGSPRSREDPRRQQATPSAPFGFWYVNRVIRGLYTKKRTGQCGQPANLVEAGGFIRRDELCHNPARGVRSAAAQILPR